MMLTTQFFAMKIQRYMHDFGITRETLAKDRREGATATRLATRTCGGASRGASRRSSTRGC